MAIKTEFTQELKKLMEDMYSPGQLDQENTVHLTLSNIWNQVTQILPEQWIDESDVYQCLVNLDYKPHNITSEQIIMNKDGEKEAVNVFGLYYIVKMN